MRIEKTFSRKGSSSCSLCEPMRERRTGSRRMPWKRPNTTTHRNIWKVNKLGGQKLKHRETHVKVNCKTIVGSWIRILKIFTSLFRWPVQFRYIPIELI